MDLLLSWVNAAACGLISLALIGAILSPKVHDGIVIKVGLICLAAGFGAIALRLIDGVAPDEVVGLERALLLVNAGIAVVIVGYLMRKARRHHPVRRSTDWAQLMDTRPMEIER
jgi:hypothetical protein